MTHAELELLVDRICSGRVVIRLAGKAVLLNRATAADRYRADEEYVTALREAADKNLPDEAAAEQMARAKKKWSDEDQETLVKLKKVIEDLKVEVFKTKGEKRTHCKTVLAATKKRVDKFLARKQTFADTTREAFASTAKNRLLVLLALPKKLRLSCRANGSLLDQAVAAYHDAILTEKQIRAAARSDYWQSLVRCRDHCGGVFGSVAELTREQSALVSWHQAYEVARSTEDGPEEDDISDDDAFDGWLIVRRRDHDSKKNQKTGESYLTNDKLRNCGEVFILAQHGESPADAPTAADIESFNSPLAKAKKAARMKAVAERGSVLEAEMPDTAQEIRMAFNRRSR